MKPQTRRGDSTREALILSALQTFSEKGFDAVSTRELATHSGANQALISYHFGSKEGLYLAVFDHIASRVREHVGPLAAELCALLEKPEPATSSARKKRYLRPLLELVEAMLSLLLSPETEYWAQLILREQARPTAAFDRLYDGFMGATLDLLTRLVMRLRGDEDEMTAKLLVIGILGQVVIWRAARAGALRHLKWKTLGTDRLAAVKAAARRNIAAQLLN